MANLARPGEVAVLLRQAREGRGVSVRMLAPKIRKPTGDPIAPSFITDIEKGRSVPSDFIAEQLAGVLGINVSGFLEACRRDRSR